MSVKKATTIGLQLSDILSPREGLMPMRKSRFREEQIAHALRQANTGTPVTEVCRAMGVSERT